MKQTTITKINNVKTLKNYLDVLQSEFKTTECKPGRFVKSTLIHLIVTKMIDSEIVVKEEIKQECLHAENIQKFLEIIKNNFDVNGTFHSDTLKGLAGDTQKLMLLTGLKEK